MKTFSSIKNKLQKYESEISLLKESIMKQTDILKADIIAYWYTTKFLSIKLENGNREYYYLSNLDIVDSKYFHGVKLSWDGKMDVGKILFSPILSAIQYEAISPDRFFGKMKTLGININDNDNPIICELNSFRPIVVHCHTDKKPVIGYCRLSQDTNCKNKFDRQISLIRNFIEKYDEYELLECFTETVRGDISLSNRVIISDMLEYCSCHNVHTVIVSELNRLGRTKQVILSSISFLRKHNITEIYVLKEDILINEEFIANRYRQLNSLAKSCEDEYENIKYRMKEGYNAYIEKRKEAIENGETNVPALGRQNYHKKKDAYLKDYEKELDLLFKSNMSLRQVQTITGTSLGTLQKIKKMLSQEVTTFVFLLGSNCSN